MKVRLLYFNNLNDITGTAEEWVDIHEGATVWSLLVVLSSKHGEVFEQHALAGHAGRPGIKLCYLFNGQNVEHLYGLDTKLAPGTTLSIFPHVGGG